MADKVSFELYGLDEFRKSLDKVRWKYPKEMEKEIYKLAGEFVKDANDNLQPKTGDAANIKKSWHRERVKEGGFTDAVDIWNSDRKYHLLERGHVVKFDPQHFAAYEAGKLDSSKKQKKYKRGKRNPRLVTRGFAPGLYFTEKARNQWKYKYPEAIGAFLNKLLKSENL